MHKSINLKLQEKTFRKCCQLDIKIVISTKTILTLHHQIDRVM